MIKKMGETLHSGPLDIARQVSGDTTALAELVMECDDGTAAAQSELAALVLAINERHPYIGLDVKVDGAQLVPSVGSSGGVYPLTLERPDPWSVPPAEYTPVRGVYCGLTVRLAYHPEQNGLVHVAVHKIKTGSAYYPDEYGHDHDVTYYQYVWAAGSEVEPVLPLYAHSFKDLGEDKVTTSFDKVAFSSMSVPRKLRAIGSIANKALRQEEEKADINQQRISYLNSLGLLEGVLLASKDVIVEDRNDYLAEEEVSMTDLSQEITIRPDMFDVLPGYERQADGSITFGHPPELFVTTHSGDSPILMPLKKVLRIETAV